jgi:hypothetical protein
MSWKAEPEDTVMLCGLQDNIRSLTEGACLAVIVHPDHTRLCRPICGRAVLFREVKQYSRGYAAALSLNDKNGGTAADHIRIHFGKVELFRK